MVLSTMRPKNWTKASEIPAKGRFDVIMRVVGRKWRQTPGGSHASVDLIQKAVAAEKEYQVALRPPAENAPYQGRVSKLAIDPLLEL